MDIVTILLVSVCLLLIAAALVFIHKRISLLERSGEDRSEFQLFALDKMAELEANICVRNSTRMIIDEVDETEVSDSSGFNVAGGNVFTSSKPTYFSGYYDMLVHLKTAKLMNKVHSE